MWSWSSTKSVDAECLAHQQQCNIIHSSCVHKKKYKRPNFPSLRKIGQKWTQNVVRFTLVQRKTEPTELAPHRRIGKRYRKVDGGVAVTMEKHKYSVNYDEMITLFEKSPVEAEEACRATLKRADKDSDCEIKCMVLLARNLNSRNWSSEALAWSHKAAELLESNPADNKTLSFEAKLAQCSASIMLHLCVTGKSNLDSLNSVASNLREKSLLSHYFLEDAVLQALLGNDKAAKDSIAQSVDASKRFDTTNYIELFSLIWFVCSCFPSFAHFSGHRLIGDMKTVVFAQQFLVVSTCDRLVGNFKSAAESASKAVAMLAEGKGANHWRTCSARLVHKRLSSSASF